MNPAITLAYMIRRDKDADHMSKTLGVCYMLAQLAGALCGALMMSFMLWGIYDLRPNTFVTNEMIFGAMMQESLGTLILVQFYLMQTDERMHYSKEPAINCFIISSSYNAARAIFNGVGDTVTYPYGACLNPAIAVGITLASLINTGGKAFTYFWIYPVMPFAGAIGAWAFYEFIYKKTQMMLDHTRAEHDEEVQDDIMKASDEDDGVLDQ
jgi:glycerol uptake facilitator-like aquaporin